MKRRNDDLLDTRLTSRRAWYRARYDDVKPLPLWARVAVWGVLALLVARALGVI
jgi:hypothetical protein